MEIVRRDGTCRFCGQMRSQMAPETLPQFQVDEMASKYCGCPEAQLMRDEEERKARMDRAKDAIRTLFEEEWPVAVEVFEQFAEDVADGNLASIVIKHPEENWTAKMVRSKDDGIKVTSKKVIDRSAE